MCVSSTLCHAFGAAVPSIFLLGKVQLPKRKYLRVREAKKSLTCPGVAVLNICVGEKRQTKFGWMFYHPVILLTF